MYPDQNRSGTDLSRLQIGLNWPGQIMLQVWISCSRLLLAAPGCSWLLWAAPGSGSSWLGLSGSIWGPTSSFYVTRKKRTLNNISAPNVRKGAIWLSPGCSWLLLTVPGCSWLLLAPAGCSWVLLAALAAPGCCWLLLVSSWLLLAASKTPDRPTSFRIGSLGGHVIP